MIVVYYQDTIARNAGIANIFLDFLFGGRRCSHDLMILCQRVESSARNSSVRKQYSISIPPLESADGFTNQLCEFTYGVKFISHFIMMILYDF